MSLWGNQSSTGSFNFSGNNNSQQQQQQNTATQQQNSGFNQTFGTPQNQSSQQSQFGGNSNAFGNNLGNTQGGWQGAGSNATSTFGGGFGQMQQQQPQPHQQQQLGYSSFGSGQQSQYSNNNIPQSSSSFFTSSNQGGQGGLSYSSSQPFGLSSQQNATLMHSSSGNQSSGTPQNAVPRYMTGYLTGGTFAQSSPRQSTSDAAYDGRMSPEQQHHQTRDSSGFGAGSSRLFGSTTSSAGTGGGKDSPSRSPRTSLFGSNRNLVAVARARHATSPTDGAGDYMDEDAPPTDSLAEFDDDTPDFLHGGSAQASQSSQTLVRRNGPENGDSANGTSQAAASKGQSPIYKITVFGFQPSYLQTVVSVFETFDKIVYNSASSSAATAANGAQSDIPPSGANWVTLGYDNEVAAVRALRKNGEVIRGNIMIGVKWTEGAPPSSSLPSGPSADEASAPASLPRSNTSSAIGQPARILPANQAYLNPATSKPSTSSNLKTAAVGRLSEMGRPDPSIFKDAANAEEKKEGGGVWGTVSNLIFGF